MRVLRKLGIDILLGLAVGLAAELVKGLIPYLPWICFALLIHFTQEISEIDFVREGLARVKRKMRGWEIVIAYIVVGTLGAGLFSAYWWGLDKVFVEKIASYEQEKHPHKRIVPMIVWNDPAPINYGVQLSTAQLNPTCDTKGKFDYSPDIGAVLPVGTHILLATFTPDEPEKYETVEKRVNLSVNPVPPPSPVTPSAHPAKPPIPTPQNDLIPSLDVLYDVGSHSFNYINRGTSNIYIWGGMYDTTGLFKNKVLDEPRTISANGGSYHIVDPDFEKKIRAASNGTTLDTKIPLQIYITMDDQRKRVMKYLLWVRLMDGDFKVDVQALQPEYRDFTLQ